MRYLLIGLMCLGLVGCEGVRNNRSIIRRTPTGSAFPTRFVWQETCWVRALDKLNEIRDDKNIYNAELILSSFFDNEQGHAWIKYTIKEKGKFYIIEYDPSRDEIKSRYRWYDK